MCIEFADIFVGLLYISNGAEVLQFCDAAVLRCCSVAVLSGDI